MRRLITKILWNLVLNILALAGVIYLLPAVVFGPELNDLSSQIRALVVVGGIIGILNVVLKPLIMLLSLPVIILTIGLFLLVINTFVFWLAVGLVPGAIVVTDPSAYFWGALLFSILNSVEQLLFPFRAKKD